MTKCTLVVCAINSVMVIICFAVGVFVVPLYHVVLHAAFAPICLGLLGLVTARPAKTPLAVGIFLVFLSATMVSTDFLDIEDRMRFVWHFASTAAAFVIGGVVWGIAALGLALVLVIWANAVHDLLSLSELITFSMALIVTFAAMAAMARQFLRCLEALERSRDALDRLSKTDALTGLPNRETLQRCLEDFTESGREFGLVMADLDAFKQINDGHGHVAGDRVLCDAAQCLSGAVRDGDVVARFGGEEFCVLLPGADPRVAEARAETMRRHLEARALIVDGQALRYTGSFGVAHSAVPHHDPTMIIMAADRALYRAKAAGRNCVRMAHWDPEDQSSTRRNVM